MKYLFPLPAVGAFCSMAILARHTSWEWLLLAGWIWFGLVLFILVSRHWDIWWTRKHFRNRLADRLFQLAIAAFVLLYSAAWPLWIRVGDVLD